MNAFLTYERIFSAYERVVLAFERIQFTENIVFAHTVNMLISKGHVFIYPKS
jgi:hypothetical protein